MYRFSSTVNPMKINGSYYEVNPNDNKLNNKVTNEDGSVELIRRAETIEDYFATLYYDGSVLKK